MDYELLEQCRQSKTTSDREWKERSEAHRRLEAEQAECIREVLKDFGCIPIMDNGYAFTFDYAGFRYQMVNQNTRICGEYYIVPKDAEEEELFQGIDRGMKTPLGSSIRRYFRFQDFCIDGDPASKLRLILSANR